MRRFWAKLTLACRLRARQADVGEPALLLQARRAALVQAALVGEQPLLPARQEHDVELQPLGRVQRHQRDALVAVVRVDVHDQRDVLQEALQRLELVHEADSSFRFSSRDCACGLLSFCHICV